MGYNLSHIITFSAESCVIVDFPSEDVEYKRVCKDVTSVHCPTTRRSKREAEADPQWSAVPLSSSAWPWASNTRFQPLFQFQNAVPARYPASTATFLYPGSYKPLATPQVWSSAIYLYMPFFLLFWVINQSSTSSPNQWLFVLGKKLFCFVPSITSGITIFHCEWLFRVSIKKSTL